MLFSLAQVVADSVQPSTRRGFVCVGRSGFGQKKHTQGDVSLSLALHRAAHGCKGRLADMVLHALCVSLGVGWWDADVKQEVEQ